MPCLTIVHKNPIKLEFDDLRNVVLYHVFYITIP